MRNKATVEILADAERLARRAAELFTRAAAKAIGDRGIFAVVLAGGSTPKAAYELLAGDEFRRRIRWKSVRFYIGDERNVPPGDERSNYRMARETLLEPLAIAPDNVVRWKTETGGPDDAAREFDRQLGRLDGGFDLVLLGLGDDGHTASLFPGSDALSERGRMAVATTIPPTGEVRLTITLPVINAAREIVFLVSGERKAAVVKQILADDGPSELPAARVAPDHGQLIWLLDAAAAAQLDRPADLHLSPHAS